MSLELCTGLHSKHSHPARSYTPPKIQDHHEWTDSISMLGYDIAWLGQESLCWMAMKRFIQAMSKLNTLVAIEVLVESRGVWLHLLLCIRVILWGEAILGLKVGVVILLLFVCCVNQACVRCRSEERLAAHWRHRVWQSSTRRGLELRHFGLLQQWENTFGGWSVCLQSVDVYKPLLLREITLVQRPFSERRSGPKRVGSGDVATSKWPTVPQIFCQKARATHHRKTQ